MHNRDTSADYSFSKTVTVWNEGLFGRFGSVRSAERQKCAPVLKHHQLQGANQRPRHFNTSPGAMPLDVEPPVTVRLVSNQSFYMPKSWSQKRTMAHYEAARGQDRLSQTLVISSHSLDSSSCLCSPNIKLLVTPLVWFKHSYKYNEQIHQ